MLWELPPPIVSSGLIQQLDRSWDLGRWEGLGTAQPPGPTPLPERNNSNNNTQLLSTYYVQAFYLHKTCK